MPSLALAQWRGDAGNTICFFPSRKWTNVFRNRIRKMQLRKRFAELKHSLFLPPRGWGAAAEVRERSPIFTYKILSNKIKFRQDEFVFKSGLTWFIYERRERIHPQPRSELESDQQYQQMGKVWPQRRVAKLRKLFLKIIFPQFDLIFVHVLVDISASSTGIPVKRAEFTVLSIFTVKLSTRAGW